MPPFVPRKRHRSQTPPSDPALSASPSAASKSQGKAKKTASLFQEADASRKSVHTLEDNQNFLHKQAGEDEEDESSQLSDADSDDFEDAMPPSNSKRRKVESTPRRAGLEEGADDRSDDDDDVDEDEEMEWEDATHNSQQEPTISGDLHLTLDELPQHSAWAYTNPFGKKKGPTKLERSIRTSTHCMHVQSLLFHNLIRNRWICDKTVQKTLTDSLPPGIIKEIKRFRKACGIADPEESHYDRSRDKSSSKGNGKEKKLTPQHKNQRDWGYNADEFDEEIPSVSGGDPIIRLLNVLSSFWRKKFTVTAPGLRKQGYKEMARLEQELKSFRSSPYDADEHGERVQDLEEFRSLANSSKGSRDIGAQLFTALLRAIGLDARIVNNIQALGFGWSKQEDALPAKAKSKAMKQPNRKAPSTEIAARNMATGQKSPVPPIKARSHSRFEKASASKRGDRVGGDKSQPIYLSDDDSELSSAPDSDNDLILDITPSDVNLSSRKYDRDLPFPVYWSEVFSPMSQTWVPVDPIVLSLVAGHPEAVAKFEPRGGRAEKAKQVLAYVVAFAADGTAKDVTVRYLKRRMWPGKTRGVRLPVEKVPVYNKNGKIKRHEEYDWFKSVMSCFARSSHQRTLADDIEESRDLQPVRINRDPTKTGGETLQGYKNSTEFVLERHLRREEALRPGAKQIRTFATGKGDKAKLEPVYRRKDVVPCRTTESWHKQGREVKEGEQPLKLVPMRAVTTIRKREIEEAERESGEKQKQGLYSLDQTDWIIPPPIKDGVIPKNAFGNMDVYVPTMVPEGGVHVPLRGTAKVCRRLEIDYAEACTGFEFGNRMAVPILTGVVVAKEHEHAVIDAWEAEMAQKRAKEEAKREKIALGMWKKMLTGLRVIERVRKEYGDEAEGDMSIASLQNDVARGKKRKKKPTTQKIREMSVRDLNDGQNEANGESLTYRDFEEAAKGGGGFLTTGDLHSDSEGGFLHTHAGNATGEDGGLILQSDGKEEPGPIRAHDGSSYGSQTSKSFVAQTKDSEALADGTEDIPGNIRRLDPTGKRAKKTSSSKVPTNDQSSTPRSLRSNKLDSALTPPESPIWKSDSLSERSELAKKKSSNVDMLDEPNGHVRRNRKRKNVEAARSRYFEGSSDDGDIS